MRFRNSDGRSALEAAPPTMMVVVGGRTDIGNPGKLGQREEISASKVVSPAGWRAEESSKRGAPPPPSRDTTWEGGSVGGGTPIFWRVDGQKGPVVFGFHQPLRCDMGVVIGEQHSKPGRPCGGERGATHTPPTQRRGGDV